MRTWRNSECRHCAWYWDDDGKSDRYCMKDEKKSIGSRESPCMPAAPCFVVRPWRGPTKPITSEDL